MNEKLLERKVVHAVEAVCGQALKFSSAYDTGYPDRLVLLPLGKALWVEVKSTGKKLKPKQQIRKRQLEAIGFKVYVVDDEKSLNAFLDAL